MNTKGKGFNLVEILEQSKKAIYNAFGAANLLAGENGGGSYNLIEGQNSNHAFTVKRAVTLIEEVWNKDIFPQLFRLNEWKLSPKDIPKFKAGAVQEVSIEEFSKGVQRCQNFLPIIPDVLNQVYKGLGIDYELDENLTTEQIREMLPTFENHTGKSDGTSGTGTTQSGGASSAVNSENKA